MVKEIALGLIATLLLEPLETNYHAKNDVSEDAEYIGYQYKIVEDENDSSIADQYTLSVYLEDSSEELVPLKLLYDSAYVSSPTTLTYSIENVLSKTYEGSALVSAALNVTAGSSVEIPFVAELQTEISAEVGGEIGVSLSTEEQEINLQSFEIEVDGVNNKFGYYAFVHCAATSYKFYFKYDHYRIANYDQMDMYRTLLLHENTDCHVYLPTNPSRNVNTVFYFETLAEYNDFCDTWNL